MKLYWPNAIIVQARPDSVVTDKISTYDGALTEKAAKAQIELWADGYGFEIQEAWIDVYETDIQKNVGRIDVEL